MLGETPTAFAGWSRENLNQKTAWVVPNVPNFG